MGRKNKSKKQLEAVDEYDEHRRSNERKNQRREDRRGKPTKKNYENKIIREQRRGVKGQCVFNALLAGVINLNTDGPLTHKDLLLSCRNHIQMEQLCHVSFNGVPLTSQEFHECQQSIPNIYLANGYYCAAMDPLLVMVAASFSVNIVHEYMSNKFEFTVKSPKRIVYLESNASHMNHVGNRNLSNGK